MHNDRLSHLFELHVSKKATVEEQEELMTLLAGEQNEEQSKELFTMAWEKFNPSDRVFSEEQSKKMLIQVLGADEAVKSKTMKLWPRVPAISTIWKIAAVAAIVFGIWFVNSDSGSLKQVQGDVVVNDIAPGKNTARLTLANGRTIELNDTKTGVIIEATKLTYSDGSEVALLSPSRRERGAREGSKVQMLTASTPRGGTYQVILPDGTRVWLNAASSLKFPSTFASLKKRSVFLSGEAYFEVAKDKGHPFIVSTDKQQVEVLGTHFNINSYSEEHNTKTTLLEGSVRVVLKAPINTKSSSNTGSTSVLIPGQQATLTGNNIAVAAIKIENAVAWKNGYFSFNDENIQSIMRELSRWYNVDVKYEGEISSQGFYAKISRNNNISQVLNALQSTKVIHFKVEGRRVTITQ